ncbi:unnamed protein product, partial [Musa acuminata var. zebrina]
LSSALLDSSLRSFRLVEALFLLPFSLQQSPLPVLMTLLWVMQICSRRKGSLREWRCKLMRSQGKAPRVTCSA